MTVSATEAFDAVTKVILKNYPRATAFKMPFCDLYVEPVTKDRYYRVHMQYKTKPEDWLITNAIARVDPESGTVVMFRDEATWQ